MNAERARFVVRFSKTGGNERENKENQQGYEV